MRVIKPLTFCQHLLVLFVLAPVALALFVRDCLKQATGED